MSGAPIANDPAAVDARVVKALSHPTRRRILELLQERELASPVELAGDLEIPLGTVSYHVRKLEELGFIELASRTQRRGAIEHHYRASASLDRPRRRRAAAASDGPAVSSRGRAAIGTVEEAQAALARGGFDTPRAGAYGRTLMLDEPGSSQAREAIRRSLAKVEQIGRASALRRERAEGGAAAGPALAVAVCALFELEGE